MRLSLSPSLPPLCWGGILCHEMDSPLSFLMVFTPPLLFSPHNWSATFSCLRDGTKIHTCSHKIFPLALSEGCTVLIYPGFIKHIVIKITFCMPTNLAPLNQWLLRLWKSNHFQTLFSFRCLPYYSYLPTTLTWMPSVRLLQRDAGLWNGLLDSCSRRGVYQEQQDLQSYAFAKLIWDCMCCIEPVQRRLAEQGVLLRKYSVQN